MVHPNMGDRISNLSQNRNIPEVTFVVLLTIEHMKK